MPVPVAQIQSLTLPERLPYAQAIDMYTTLPLEYVQGPDDNPRRWLAGVEFVPRAVPTSTVVVDEDPCTLLNSFASSQGFDSEVAFYPFRVENSITCSSVGGFTEQQLTDWILAETRSIESYDLARQVWGQGGPNPDLRDSADDVTTAGDVTALGALAAVVGGLDRRLKGRRGLIHMSSDMLVRLVAAGGLVQRAGEYQTPNGHRVVADAGYDGSGPSGLALGNSWIYGSGPVFYRMTDVEQQGEWWESFNRVHNDFVAHVSRYALFLFEPAFVVAARASVATTIA